MAGKKLPGAVFDVAYDDPKGRRQGWQATKKGMAEAIPEG
jgi:hypothetical protein